MRNVDNQKAIGVLVVHNHRSFYKKIERKEVSNSRRAGKKTQNFSECNSQN